MPFKWRTSIIYIAMSFLYYLLFGIFVSVYLFYIDTLDILTLQLILEYIDSIGYYMISIFRNTILLYCTGLYS